MTAAHEEAGEPVDHGLGVLLDGRVAHASSTSCTCGHRLTAYGIDRGAAHLGAHAELAEHVAEEELRDEFVEEFGEALGEPGVTTVGALAEKLAAAALAVLRRGPTVQDRGDDT